MTAQIDYDADGNYQVTIDGKESEVQPFGEPAEVGVDKYISFNPKDGLYKLQPVSCQVEFTEFEFDDEEEEEEEEDDIDTDEEESDEEES